MTTTFPRRPHQRGKAVAIGVFALSAPRGEPLATARLVQPWMALVVPPLDELAAAGEGRPNGTLRVLVAPLDDRADAVPGSVAFNDPLDQGLLAAVQLDRDVSWPYQPIDFGHLTAAGVAADGAPNGTVEQATVDAVHRHLLDPGRRSGPAADVRGAERLPWPAVRPGSWPLSRAWPPTGDAATHWGICSIIPCCWGCPANPRCSVQPPPVA